MAKSRRFPDPPITAAIDRGPARHFHGRKQILRNFDGLLGGAAKTDTGTIFLIQGAPGAGKTALLAECERIARGREWEVANIGVGSLWDPYKLLDSLGLGDKYEVTEKSTQFGVKDVAGRGYKSTRLPRTVLSILKDGDQPLLLILDESQGLGEDGVPPSDYRADARTVLDFIHNGKLGRPVILLAAGLGTTLKSFESLEVSRFASNCFVELGALDKGAERAVIQDWLKKDGGAKGDPKAWIDAIAKEAHGWPHHILSYVYPAAVDQLKVDDGIMTTDGLNVVLYVGREGRNAYYEQRMKGFSRKQRRSLANLIVNIPSEDGLDEEDIKASLSQEYGKTEADKMFHDALRKGLLDEHSGCYVVPIPSMLTWLKKEYVSSHHNSV